MPRRSFGPKTQGPPIIGLTPIAVSEWEVAQIGEGVSGNAVGRCHGLLDAACTETVRMGQMEVGAWICT